MKRAALSPFHALLPFLALLVAAPALLISSPCAAQFGLTGAQSTLFEPSVRSSGMGRTGIAVAWGVNPNDWANPALVPYNSGLRYEASKTQLVPELADDVFLKTNRIVWSGYGIGVSIAGRPVDETGGVRLDFGESEATDEDGNPLAKFHVIEDNNTVAVGISLFQLAGSASRWLGHALPPLDRFGDVSAGHAWKKIKAEETGATLFGSGEVEEKDRGYLVRVTPYDAIRYPGLLPALESVLRLTLEGSYGASELNSNAKDMEYQGRLIGPSVLPVLEDHRRGVAYHAALALPRGIESGLRDSGRGWIYELITPLVSYTNTREHTIFYLRGDAVGDEEKRNGWEITVLNVFSYRRGHQDDPSQQIVGDTKGWGVGFHFRGVAGIQYDHAEVPQSTLLGNVKRNGVFVYVDPVWALRRIR